GLARQPIDLVPIDAQRPLVGKVLLRALYWPLETPWKYGQLNRVLTARAIRRQARRTGCDVVVTTADDDMFAGMPTYAYQDMNYSAALGHLGTPGGPFVSVIPTTTKVLERLEREQRNNYELLAGIFTFGSWFRDWLVDGQGIPSERVHVVGAGINNVLQEERRPARRGRL